MSARSIASCSLKNGLSLICQDQSKKIAADRWYICVWVKIFIPVKIKWFKNQPMDEKKFQQIATALGPEILFSQKRERNFISDELKDSIIQELCENAMVMGTQYCGSRDFAAKAILKEFANHRQGRHD